MNRLSEQQKEQIITLYESGLNIPNIKSVMGFKYHQPILNVLKYYSKYTPYRNGKGTKRKYTLNEDYFSVIDSEEKAYFLGFICADGHVDTQTRRVKIVLKSTDVEILEKFKASVGSNAPIKNIIRKTSFNYGVSHFYHSSFEVCSSKLVTTLESFGLVSNKTYTLDHTIIDVVPEVLKRHFLRGYFDGDGSIILGKDLKKIGVEVLANLDFLLGTFQRYFPTNTKLIKAKCSRQSYYYRVTARGEILKFLHMLYKDSNVYLQRKFNRYTLLCGHLKPFELLETVQAISSEANSPLERSETIEK